MISNLITITRRIYDTSKITISKIHYEKDYDYEEDTIMRKINPLVQKLCAKWKSYLLIVNR